MLPGEIGFATAVSDTSEDSYHGKSDPFEYVVAIDPTVLFLIDRGADVVNEATVDDTGNRISIPSIE